MSSVMPYEQNGAVQIKQNDGGQMTMGINNNAIGSGTPSVMGDAQKAREVAEVQAKVMLARSMPRNEVYVLDSIKNACQREKLALKATYVYSRGGSEIFGPSIRLAEAIAQYWTNFEYGSRQLQVWRDERGFDVSKVEAYAWDQERNVSKKIIFDVPHLRVTKRGSFPLTDPRDVYENIANQASRRVRNCILAVIPGDIVEEALEQCQKTLQTKVQLTPERIKKMLDSFSVHGITREMIEAKIQRRVDSMTAAQFVQLGQIYTSIEDGMGNPKDFFNMEDTSTESGKTNVLENVKKAAVRQSTDKTAEGEK